MPLDGRPCNVRFPCELGALAGFDLSVPPVEVLGDAQQPARRDRLQAWLEREREGATAWIFSLDTWVYGNLVASRKSRDETNRLLAQLEKLRDLKQQQPQMRLYAFATLLRLSDSNDATEERPYWAQHGRQIYRLSWLEHRLQGGAEARAQAEYDRLLAVIPPEVLADYRQLRQRNQQILLAALDWVQEGTIEQLLIGCDDSGEYGWGVQERQRLEGEIKSRHLGAQVLLYPGADELGSVLLARALVPQKAPLRLRWTHPEAREQITRYEGLPLLQTLTHQAHACGVTLLEDDDETEAHVPLLWLHNPPRAQIDQFLEREERVDWDADSLANLFQALDSGTPVLLADLLYANGGDIRLLKMLESRQLLFRLQAYAAWNTVGNSLGTVLAWYKLLSSGQVDPQRQRRFLLERLVDDGWYQGLWRQELSRHYSDPVTLNTCLQLIARCNDLLRNWQTWMKNPPTCLQVERLTFPWRRFFEIDLSLCFKSSKTPADG